MPARHQTVAQVLVVVDLPVEHDDFGAVFVEHRLPAAPQIDDAEPPHAEANRPAHVESLVVGAAMSQGGAHATHKSLRDGPFPLAVHNACDAAHVASLPVLLATASGEQEWRHAQRCLRGRAVLPRRNRCGTACLLHTDPP